MVNAEHRQEQSVRRSSSARRAVPSLAVVAGVIASVAGFAACSGRDGAPAVGIDDAGGDASGAAAEAGGDGSAVADGPAPIDGDGDASSCEGAPPASLACTGLYADLAAKTIAPGVQAFTPAVPLWSDGSGKNRWVMLPAGGTIDRSSPNDWVFPPGTKFWKEFSRDGQRRETRFFQKQADGSWVWVSYVWNGEETAATATPAGASLALEDGATYQVPSQQQCTECHDGRPEHIMGFEEVSLGSPGAAGLTLAQLAAQGSLTPPPARTSLAIGDDGSGDVARALGWLHINCGVPCHNANALAGASSETMRLRLDATQLDGRSAASMDPVVTTVGVGSSTALWGTFDRIQPGDPDDSLLVRLVSTRGAGRQMPPLASAVVDAPEVAILRDWIEKMPPLLDGGAGDGAPADGATDGPLDATDAATDAAGSAAGDATPE